MTANLNYVAGRWVAGETMLEDRSPSDIDDLIGVYAQASVARLHEAVAAAEFNTSVKTADTSAGSEA